MEFLILWVGLALVAAIVASAKRRFAIGYFLLALALPLIGVLIALALPAGPEREAGGRRVRLRKCPFCAESVRVEALKCRHCGSAIAPPASPPVC